MYKTKLFFTISALIVSPPIFSTTLTSCKSNEGESKEIKITGAGSHTLKFDNYPYRYTIGPYTIEGASDQDEVEFIDIFL
ncbi:MAG: hypothetical protein HUJ52_03445 [Malacoplasma sp.]|nr:hypothetical protein [Malacoplasma sp.]